MNQTEWTSRLRTIAKARDGSNWAFGDVLSEGRSEYGKEKFLKLAQHATGYNRSSLWRIVNVTEHFPVPLRFDSLSWLVYVSLQHFPVPFLETFLPAIADSGLSARIIREKAVAAYGSEPEKGGSYKPSAWRFVRLSSRLCDSLIEASGSAQITGTVTRILDAWLAAQKDAGPANPGVGNDVQSATTQPETSAAPEAPRPTYAEWRAAQKAATAEKQAAKCAAEEARKAELKAEGKFRSKIKIAFADCKGPARDFVDTENGAAKIEKKSRLAADRFHSLEDALEAAREYSEDRKYVVVPFRCRKCSNGHPVYHLRAAAQVDLSAEQLEVRTTVTDFIQSTRASLRQKAACSESSTVQNIAPPASYAQV